MNNTNDMSQQRNKKKCHGNRNDQRFRKKYRIRGMKPETIEQLLRQRKEIQNNNKSLYETEQTNMTNVNPTTTVVTNTNKRKRDLSIQELNTNETSENLAGTMCVQQLSRKKHRNETKSMIKNVSINYRSVSYLFHSMFIRFLREKSLLFSLFFRQPLYLMCSSTTLFTILNTRLKYTFKRKNEQQFIYVRLNLFDRQHFLEIEQQLWNEYLHVGLEQNIWPVRNFFLKAILII